MTKPPCQCGTGRYCKRHQTYATRGTRTLTRSDNRTEAETISRVIHHQDAGGGIRIIRRALNQ